MLILIFYFKVIVIRACIAYTCEIFQSIKVNRKGCIMKLKIRMRVFLIKNNSHLESCMK